MSDFWPEDPPPLEGFTEIYYPQRFKYYVPAKGETFPLQKSMLLCDMCGGHSEPMRVDGGWPYHCVPCLKRSAFARTGGRPVVLPVEVLMQVMCYLRHYQDLARSMRVSKRWFDAANYDTAAENELTETKRILLGREVYLQFLWSPNNPLVVAFQDRLTLASLFGEWNEATVKRRLALANLIVHSRFYLLQLGLQSVGVEHLNSSYLPDSATTEPTQMKFYVGGKEVLVSAPNKENPTEYVVLTQKLDNINDAGKPRHTRMSYRPCEVGVDANTGRVLWCGNTRGKARSCCCS